MTDATRNIVDYAIQDDAVKFREALYASIHDKVTDHLCLSKSKDLKISFFVFF
jgi:hypothetical protein